jgi:hypothetical protein
MPDLSAQGIGGWVAEKGDDLADVVREAEKLELWPPDQSGQVIDAAVELGRALDECVARWGEDALRRIATPKVLDDFRVALAYMRAARRLRLLGWLSDVSQQSGQNIAAEILVGQSEDPGTAVARRRLPTIDPREAARVLRVCVRHLNRRQLVGAVFATGRVNAVLAAALADAPAEASEGEGR